MRTIDYLNIFLLIQFRVPNGFIGIAHAVNPEIFQFSPAIFRASAFCVNAGAYGAEVPAKGLDGSGMVSALCFAPVFPSPK